MKDQPIFIGMAIGAIITFSLIWSFVEVMNTGSPMRVRPGLIGVGIDSGGMLVWLGAMLLKIAINGKSKSR